MTFTEAPWQAKAAAKRAQLLASLPSATLLPAALLDSLEPTSSVLDIPRTSGLLTPRQLAITEETQSETLLQKLAGGEYSAVEVCAAFCARASIAQQLVGCLTETMFDRAEKRAQELDEHLQKTGELIGPLHGSVSPTDLL